jgi:superoxide dismutase, Fe-Mn family
MVVETHLLFSRIKPYLALDIYEHSYHMDYGAKAAAYVYAFMQNINWDSAARRLPNEAGDAA